MTTQHHIYFNSEKRKDVLESKTTSAFEKYTIIQNESLQAENREMRLHQKSLEQKLEELEDENERFDASKRYMRGLLKNLVELDRLRKQKNKEQASLTLSLRTKTNKGREAHKVHTRVFQSVLLVVAAMTLSFYSYETYFDQLSIFLSSMMIIWYQERTLRDFPTIERGETTNVCIANTNKQIRDIENAQSFLEEHIDSL